MSSTGAELSCAATGRSAEPLLAARDLRLEPGHRAVLDGLSIAVAGGEVHALRGPNDASSHSIDKSRVALRDEATAEIVGATHGNAAHARGHVGCTENVRDRAAARAVPEVSVTHPLAKVTHEAAIGVVDTRQLETLMASGVAPDEAVDIMVRGLLK